MRRPLALGALAVALATTASAQGFLGTISPPPGGLVGGRMLLDPTPAAAPSCVGMRGPARELPPEADSRKTRLEGRDVRRAVTRLVRDLDWHDDLDAALEDAAAAGKPVLWIQALGELDGYT